VSIHLLIAFIDANLLKLLRTSCYSSL